MSVDWEAVIFAASVFGAIVVGVWTYAKKIAGGGQALSEQVATKRMLDEMLAKISSDIEASKRETEITLKTELLKLRESMGRGK